MATATVYTRTFRFAIETLGDRQRLAKAVGASVAEIEGWAAGLADPPPSVFLKAIDIVAQANSWGSSRSPAHLNS
jgi:hypothetical protein